MTAINPFRSDRLIYRAIEPTEDEAFFLKLDADGVAYRNSNSLLCKPQSKKNVADSMKHIEECLLGVMICLPATDADAAPTTVGCITLLSPEQRSSGSWSSTIGIDIIGPHQGQGYGSEAIRWALDWAFDTAGLHRVTIEAFEYNDGAKRLYEKIGFKYEGCVREMFWHAGRWWDDLHYGIIDREWREIRGKRQKLTVNR